MSNKMIKNTEFEKEIEQMTKQIIQGQESGNYVFEPNFSPVHSRTAAYLPVCSGVGHWPRRPESSF